MDEFRFSRPPHSTTLPPLRYFTIFGKLKQRKEQFANTTNKTKTKLWPPIHELTYTNGKRRWQVACMVNGERIREVYETKGQAEITREELKDWLNDRRHRQSGLPTCRV